MKQPQLFSRKVYTKFGGKLYTIIPKPECFAGIWGRDSPQNSHQHLGEKTQPAGWMVAFFRWDCLMLNDGKPSSRVSTPWSLGIVNSAHLNTRESDSKYKAVL